MPPRGMLPTAAALLRPSPCEKVMALGDRGQMARRFAAAANALPYLDVNALSPPSLPPLLAAMPEGTHAEGPRKLPGAASNRVQQQVR